MSVERRKAADGTSRYVCRWREAGKQRARVFDLRRDALDFDAAMRRRRQMGGVDSLQHGRTTLNALHEEWWKLHSPNIAASTRRSYDGIWRAYLKGQLGSARIAEITPQVVERWARDLLAKGVGWSSMERAWIVLSGMMGRAAAWGWLERNPVAVAKKPRRTHARREVPSITPRDVERLRSGMTTRDAALVSVLAYCGLRPGEALGLRWGDVGEDSIRVERAASLGAIGPTKTGRRRTVRMPGAVASDLRELRLAEGVPDDDQPVFPGPGGRVMHEDDWRNWARGTFRDAAKGAKLAKGIRPYDLRHHRASSLIKSGASLIETAAQMGHSPGTLLSTYAHVIAEWEGRPPVDIDEEIRKARRAA